MNQKIENQGNYNININGVKGDININSPEAFKYLQELKFRTSEKIGSKPGTNKYTFTNN